MYKQTVTPNPNISCRPGYCLEYVRETFDLPIRFGSATEAWVNSPSQHQDWNFPSGMWVPIYFSIDIEPNGHIALLAPDLSVYSSSDLGSIPHHHPSIADLIGYYAYWGKMQLTYLGWSEDVAGYPVVSLDSGSIGFDSITTPTQQEAELSAAEVTQIINAIKEADFGNRQFTQAVVHQDMGTTVAEVRANASAIAQRLDQGIEISRNQAEDIVASTTSRLSKVIGALQVPAAQIDVNALAAQIASTLGPGLAEQFMTAFKAQIAK